MRAFWRQRHLSHKMSVEREGTPGSRICRGRGTDAGQPGASRKTADGSGRLPGHLSERETWEVME